MFALGSIVGGCILIFLLSALIEWAAIKRMTNDAKLGVFVSVAAATAVAIVLAGFGNADGGPYNPGEMAVPSLISGAIVAAIRFLLRARQVSKGPVI
jgi:hypothetical protein